MFEGLKDADNRASKILDELGSHQQTLAHSRHISATRATELGINVTMLEDDSDLQEAVLTVHHSYVQTSTETPAFKIIENHDGVAFISAAQVAIGPAQPQQMVPPHAGSGGRLQTQEASE
ncbi:MAG TPA: hypothetical protein VJ625_09990 [Propionibacteriaceae bacterium]|nr:hypothetical protein [Propionibacteriaceae bacterium]